LSPDRWNWRCRTHGDGTTYAEVLWGAAMETPALRWIVDRYRAGSYRGATSLDHTGPLMIDGAGKARRMHIEPGTDPLLGNEPLPELPGPIPRVVLVPIADWDRWVADNPAGASWDRTHEPEILDKARALGWSAET
jgi:hypothetical protein